MDLNKHRVCCSNPNSFFLKRRLISVQILTQNNAILKSQRRYKWKIIDVLTQLQSFVIMFCCEGQEKKYYKFNVLNAGQESKILMIANVFRRPTDFLNVYYPNE